MKRSEKHAFVDEFRQTITDNALFVVTRQTGLSAEAVETLRRGVREEGGSFKIAKNTLMRIAVKDTPAEGLTQHLTGPTGITYSKDPLAAAKGIAKFAKGNDKIEILAGCLEGNMLDAAGVKALAALPPLEVLRGQLLGVITAPLQKMMGMINAPASSLVRVITARNESISA